MTGNCDSRTSSSVRTSTASGSCAAVNGNSSTDFEVTGSKDDDGLCSECTCRIPRPRSAPSAQLYACTRGLVADQRWSSAKARGIGSKQWISACGNLVNAHRANWPMLAPTSMTVRNLKCRSPMRLCAGQSRVRRTSTPAKCKVRRNRFLIVTPCAHALASVRQQSHNLKEIPRQHVAAPICPWRRVNPPQKHQCHQHKRQAAGNYPNSPWIPK